MSENSPRDPEVIRKESEAAMAEAKARIAKANKDIAEHEKDEAAAKDQDLQSANRDKAIAEAKKATAEADKESFAAQFPASATKPLEGKVELDDKAGYFAELLAYQCVKSAAKEIVASLSKELCKNEEGKEKAIYLVAKLDWQQGAAQLTEVTSRLQTFNEVFDDLVGYNLPVTKEATRLAASPLVAFAAASAVLGGIADIAALFREDRTIKGRVVSLNQTALLAEVTSELLEKNAKVYLPSLSMTLTSKIVQDFEIVRQKDAVARKKRSEINRAIGTLSQEVDAQEIKQLLPIKGHFDAAISAFAEFAVKLTSIPDGATASPLAMLSEVSLLSACTNLLYVSVVSQGGEFEARRNLWGSGKVYHRGGIVCAYILFEPTGRIILSGTVESVLHAEEGKLVTGWQGES